MDKYELWPFVKNSDHIHYNKPWIIENLYQDTTGFNISGGMKVNSRKLVNEGGIYSQQKSNCHNIKIDMILKHDAAQIYTEHIWTLQ